MCIKQALGELISGKAMRPDEEDVRYPLRTRISKGEILLLHSCVDSFRIQIVELNRQGQIRVLHDQRLQGRSLEELEEHLSAMMGNRQVRYAVWIEDHGWEVHVSRMTWTGTMQDLQDDLLEGKRVFPVDEMESSMLYSPVIVSRDGGTWLFSVRRERIQEAKRLCQGLGLRLVRSCIGVASLCRHTLNSIHESGMKEGYALLETTGGVLLLKSEGGKWVPFGQWPNLGYRIDRAVSAMEMAERISGENRNLLLYTEKGKDGLTHYLSGVAGLHLECVPGLVYESVLWDPERDIQPDLELDRSMIRPRLPRSFRYLRWLFVGVLPIMLIWLGKHYHDRTRLQEEIVNEESRLHDVRSKIAAYDREQQEIVKEQEKVERLSKWIQQVVPVTKLVSEVLGAIPQEVRIQTLAVRSYEGQRQIEWMIDPSGNLQAVNLLYPVLMDFLQTRGWQMISYEQPGEGSGHRLRGVFIHPVPH